MKDILDRLQQGDVLVGDGALGTMLMQRGLKHGEPPEAYNLTKPYILEEVASLYLEAGAEIITTNSFGASPLRLQQYSLEKEADEINRRAVEAVRRAVQDRAYVAGSVGPTGRMLKPFGSTDPEEVYSGFQRQIRALMSAGVDLICIETMTDVNEAGLAIKAARSIDPTVPVMATMTFSKTPKGFFTFMGTSVRNAVKALETAGADIIGSNCGEGSENMALIAREFTDCTTVPVAIQSNAGLPLAGNSSLVYTETPDIVAGKAAEMLRSGVRIIGGCCGTGIEHIRAIREVVDTYRATS
jgi:5-methyltetrahydrofolate--homocysteine methyltransferase